MKNEEDTNVSICGGESCSAESSAPQPSQHGANAATLELSVVSDVICPWCYVGKRHLEESIRNLKADGVQLSARWLPYELNPGMPKNGIERKEYRIRKFGSWERSQALDAQVAAAGTANGIEFRHDLMKRTPNTFDAHRLIWLADREGVQDAVVEGLFQAYFTQGKDIGDHEVLIDVAASAGLDRNTVQSFLLSGEGREEVTREIQLAQEAGLQGVPTFILNGQVLFSGAQPANVMTDILRQSLSHR